jgi:nucleoside phosphorylase
MTAESVLSVPCLLFALRRESMYFRRAYPLCRRFSGAPCRAQFRQKRCQEPFAEKKVPDTFFLTLETGIGTAAMESALRWCLSKPCFGDSPYRPRLLVSVGFSGALQPEQRVGDLVLATEVVDQQGKCWPALRPAAWVNRDIAAGRLLTMPELVGDPQEKQRLGRQYQALAVDMESAVAARLCHQHKVPFACLRVISDDWQTALSPHLVELLRQERVSPARLAGRVLRHPKLIGELWRLARQTRRASRRLLSPLSVILTNDPEFV